MSMYRSYLLKNGFFAKKGNESKNIKNKIYLKHNPNIGGVYATVLNDDVRKGVKIIADGEEHFFNNFDNLDTFLNSLTQKENDFVRILKRKNISKRLRRLAI